MRIYRDVRFSKNKEPYKTNVGIHFRHEVGKDVHAPGFYFHISPDEVFIGGGVWRPDGKALSKIREAIDDQSTRWKRIKNSKQLQGNFDAHGDRLKRPPKGFDKDHPLIDDLKLKDHLYISAIEPSAISSPEIIKLVHQRMKMLKPFMSFLCESLHLPI